MGVENRDYYRQHNAYDGTWGDWGLYHLTPVVKYLIIVNVVVFVLQAILVRDTPVTPFAPLDLVRQQHPEIDEFLLERGTTPDALIELRKVYPHFDTWLQEAAYSEIYNPDGRVSIVQEWFDLDAKKVTHGQVWRLLTHAFCHVRYGIFDILINMVFLYWFGCTLESMYGSREFLLFYLTAAVVAGLAYFALELYTAASVPGLGSSGAVMAVTMLYCWHFPRETIRLFWAIRVEIRWLIVLLVIWDLHPILLAIGGDRFVAGLGSAAHLGGLAFALLYAKFEWRLESLVARLPGIKWQGSPRSASAADMARVDQILAKIHKSGEASLTDEERTFLRDASTRMKSRRRRI